MSIYKPELPQKYKKKQISPNSRQNQNNSQIENFNFNIVTLLLVFIAAGVVLQIFRWQVLQSEKFQILAKDQYTNSQTKSSGRGIIYAADGSVLAIDEPVWTVYANLSSDENEREEFFKKKDRYISQVSSILGIKEEDISSKLTDDFRYVIIKKDATAEQKKALEEANIFGKGTEGFGLAFEKDEKRVYPDARLASHILGFIGKNDQGIDIGNYGAEGYYFTDMQPQDGNTYEEKDAQGNVILTSEYDPIKGRNGKDIKLTIIPGIQAKVEKRLKEGVEKHQAKSGSVIIMDPKTGAIISMANYPDYDPNAYWKVNDSWIYKNRAISDAYEPGSIFKPLTVSIALETDKIKPDYTCDDDTGYFQLYDVKFYTWDARPDGHQDLGDILANSNNPCIAQIGMETGLKNYYPKLLEYGVGQKVGIGLQDESTGYLEPYENWREVDLASTSFGQSVSMTALQAISALSTIANDGKRMQPYIVSEVIDEDETIKVLPKVASTPISAETAKYTTQFMKQVVIKGEAHRLFERELPGYSIAGKTGTAQIPKGYEAGYYKDKTNATFVGFAPAENPEYIMLVRLEEPGLDPYAASTAVPLWIEIFKDVSQDLGIPQTN